MASKSIFSREKNSRDNMEKSKEISEEVKIMIPSMKIQIDEANHTLEKLHTSMSETPKQSIQNETSKI